jgi:hypothetical protein
LRISPGHVGQITTVIYDKLKVKGKTGVMLHFQELHSGKRDLSASPTSTSHP